ncbi:MAG: hypothetical protein AB1422_00410 [bacterium]
MSTYQANTFQIRLIQESGLDPFVWIDNYARRFREIVDGGIEQYEKIRSIIYQGR